MTLNLLKLIQMKMTMKMRYKELKRMKYKELKIIKFKEYMRMKHKKFMKSKVMEEALRVGDKVAIQDFFPSKKIL